MQQSDPFVTIAILVAAALFGGLVAHRLRQPLILGYLVIGIVVGPHATGLVDNLEIVEMAATMGVALLMFTLGMEISLSQLREVGKIGIWGGILQIVITIVLGILAGYLIFRWPLSQSVLFGLIISLSSTAVCLKVLIDRGELASVQGRIMLAILILQDISVIFMALVIPLISGNTDNIAITLLMSLGKVLIFVAATFFLGRWVLPWLFGGVGGFRSRELFLLTVLVLCMGAAVSTQLFGLSIVFGTFLVGLVLRQTKFVYQALAEITPLRDIFTSLFFVSLGMLLNPAFIINNWTSILLTITVILVIKAGVIFTIARAFGYSTRVALLVGLGLFQLGEFGFILTQGGFDNGIVSEYVYSLILASTVITMILTPIIISFVTRLYQRISEVRAKKTIGTYASEKKDGDDLSRTESHSRIIIAGYGEVGQSIAESLREAKIPHLIIDGDPNRVSQAKTKGHPRIFGDATNIHVLMQADLSHAKALVVSYPDLVTVVSTIKAARHINPEIIILARAGHKEDREELSKLGVKSVVIPEREAGYTFAKMLLKMSDLDRKERSRVLSILREND